MFWSGYKGVYTIGNVVPDLVNALAWASLVSISKYPADRSRMGGQRATHVVADLLFGVSNSQSHGAVLV